MARHASGAREADGSMDVPARHSCAQRDSQHALCSRCDGAACSCGCCCSRVVASCATLKADSAAKRARAQQSAIDADLAQQLADDDAADESALADEQSAVDASLAQQLAADDAADDDALADEQMRADGETAAVLEKAGPSAPATYGTPPPPSMASAVKRGSEVNGVECVFNGPFAMRAGGWHRDLHHSHPQSKAVLKRKKTWNKIGFRYVDSPHGHPVIFGLDDEAVMIGVEVGMLILSINGKPVATAADAKHAFDARSANEGAVVYLSTSTVRELYDSDIHELVAQAGGKPHWS